MVRIIIVAMFIVGIYHAMAWHVSSMQAEEKKAKENEEWRFHIRC